MASEDDSGKSERRTAAAMKWLVILPSSAYLSHLFVTYVLRGTLSPLAESIFVTFLIEAVVGLIFVLAVWWPLLSLTLPALSVLAVVMVLYDIAIALDATDIMPRLTPRMAAGALTSVLLLVDALIVLALPGIVSRRYYEVSPLYTFGGTAYEVVPKNKDAELRIRSGLLPLKRSDVLMLAAVLSCAAFCLGVTAYTLNLTPRVTFSLPLALMMLGLPLQALFIMWQAAATAAKLLDKGWLD